MSSLRYFVSYRRATDGESADAICRQLQGHAGDHEVFFDRDPQSLPVGVSWPYELISNVARCETLFPVIGPGWLAELATRNQDAGGWMHESQSKDWVRREIVFALQLGKRVVPLLVNGAVLPDQNALPEDMWDLCHRQVFNFGDDPDWEVRVKELVDAVMADPSVPPPVRRRELGRPAVTPSGLPDDPEHPVGQRWDPRTETDSPHALDYKFCILDPDVRHRIRVELLAAKQSGELRHGFMLSDFQKLGEPRKYKISSVKNGMFVQASCVVTDGMSDRVITRVLFCMREEYQFHDATRLDPKNVSGESCLIGTCLTAFGLHERTGHLPKAVLNDLAEPNPWAVFSRKLLIPDSLIDCKFLGIGFNLSNPDKEYIHLVWHVRTRHCPELMLVPAREEKHYDVPIWQTMQQLAQYNFEKAPIDRNVIETMFHVSLPASPRPQKAPWLTGFLRFPGFDGTQANGNLPVRWKRDTVPLDLMRMFQQQVHKGRRVLKSSRAVDMLMSLAEYIREVAEPARLAIQVDEICFPSVRPPFDVGLKLVVADEEGRPFASYLILAVEWIDGMLNDDLVNRVRERAEAGFGDDHDPTGLLVLHGVHTPQRFEIQGAVSLHDPGRTPIHVVRVALGSQGVPVKRVAHGIIPIRRKPAAAADAMLITLSPGDEKPRLPGGGIDGIETAGQALVREIGEELALKPDEFEVSSCIVPDGVTIFEISPSSNRLTHYRIFPFVVRVVDSGIARLRRHLSSPSPDDACKVWPVSIEEWQATGMGYDHAYPRAVLPMITQEQLDAAALDDFLQS